MTMATGTAEAEVVRLRTEAAELRAGLEARAHENALLLQMISDVISTLDLEQVLRRIVDHLVAVLGCHAAFVYLWEPARERLVLRGAVERYRRFIDRLELAPGEGLVGWSYLTRKPAMLRERAMDDPRFRYFPELEEESFQAILTVPMTGADGSVVAVVSLHTVAPQEFTDEHVRMVGAVAAILGSAIETSALYESTARKLAVMSTISELAQTVRSGRYLDDAVRSLAETAIRNTASDLAVVALAEPGADRLSVRAYEPHDDTSGPVAPGTMERLPWDRIATLRDPADFGVPGWAAGDGSPATGTSRVTVPLVVAGEQLGVMALFRATARPYGDDDEALANIIANQAAIAVKNSHLADVLAERDVPARFFRDLVAGPEDGHERMRRRAALLGCEMARSHAPVALDLAPDLSRHQSRDAVRQILAALVRRRLAECFPGSLVHVDATVLALVRLPDDADGLDLPNALAPLQGMAAQEIGLNVVGGVGRACHAVADYRGGFAQAREALRVARSLGAGGRILNFDALGAMRYLTRIPTGALDDDVRDRYQECVERIAAYDARNRSAPLLQTLETYLAYGGNATAAAERLFVHRNTLVQRLDRLRGLLGFDPRDSAHWLALRIALELWRLRTPAHG